MIGVIKATALHGDLPTMVKIAQQSKLMYVITEIHIGCEDTFFRRFGKIIPFFVHFRK